MVKKSVFIARPDFPAIVYELLQKENKTLFWNIYRIVIESPVHEFKTPHLPTIFAKYDISATFDIVCWHSKVKPSTEQLIQNAKGKFGIVCSPGSATMDEEVIEGVGDSLKVVSTFSAGINHLDVEKLKSKKIRIGNTPDVSVSAVAEYAIGLLLATSRHIVEGHNATLRGEWSSEKWTITSLSGPGLYKSTVSVVGCGRIGTSIVKRLKSFEPRKIFYYARSMKPEAEKLGAELQSLDFIMKESDFIILALDLNTETEGIINKNRINSMKSNAILINIGRGRLLDENALIEALRDKKIAGAGLDVFANEPLLVDSPFNKLDNVVLTPHLAFNTEDCLNSMGELTALNVLAVLNGTEMPTEVL